MTCPAPESLVPLALGADDPVVARHVAGCTSGQLEVGRLREGAGVLRELVALERPAETPECFDELAVADFVEGRLDPQARAPVVAHLLTCARCRSVVRATGGLLADRAVTAEVRERHWRRWSLPLGIAAAAALMLLVWPRGTNDTSSAPGLRDTTLTNRVAPVPIAPRASVARVDRFVWSSVPRVDRYRMRVYDDRGAVVWTAEAADTVVALPDSVVLSPRVTYFWKVEAQTEWRRWAASDLVEFRLVGTSR